MTLMIKPQSPYERRKHRYVKAPSCQSCAVPGTAAEDNWVWSPQGVVNMHAPERWGMLQLSTAAPGQAVKKHNDEWTLRETAMATYYAQHAFKLDHGHFATNVTALAPYVSPPGALDGGCTRGSERRTSSRRTVPTSSSLSAPWTVRGRPPSTRTGAWSWCE